MMLVNLSNTLTKKTSCPYSHELLSLPSPRGGLRGVSSVGLERVLDRHEVTGSIPVHPTLIIRVLESLFLILFFIG